MFFPPILLSLFSTRNLEFYYNISQWISSRNNIPLFSKNYDGPFKIKLHSSIALLLLVLIFKIVESI